MDTWRFIRSGPASPAVNMAVDEAILIAHSQGQVPPTVRFYTWLPAALSIGYFQKAKQQIRFDRLKEHGLGFVRRPTGGRAVLHDRELTYSVIIREDHPFIPVSVSESYRVISQGLQAGYQKLGLQTSIVSLGSDNEKEKYPALGSAACFDSPSWYELVAEGRKIAGSAQTRSRGTLLQHGSILIELDADLLFEILYVPNEQLRLKLCQAFKSRAAALSELLGEPPALPVVEQAFYEGFSEGLAVSLQASGLTAYEKQLAEELVSTKYGSDEWNFRK